MESRMILQNALSVVFSLYFALFVLAFQNFPKKIRLRFCLLSGTIGTIAIYNILLLTLRDIAPAFLLRLLAVLQVIKTALSLALMNAINFFRFGERRSRCPLHVARILLPFLLATIFAITGLYTDFFFAVAETGDIYYQTPAQYSVAVCIALNFIALFYGALYKYLRRDKGDALFTLFFAIAVIMGLTVDFWFDFSGMYPAVAIGCAIFYYILLNTSNNNRDHLTGCYTRRKYSIDTYHSNLSCVIAMDLDGLKTINDEKGHIEGDQAIKTIAAAAKISLTGRSANVYRIGGDEFTILCFGMNEEQVEELLGLLKVNIAKTGYCCSIGYRMIGTGRQHSHAEVEDAIRDADRNMYSDKLDKKSAGAEARDDLSV